MTPHPPELARDSAFHKEWRSWGSPNITPEIHAAIAEPMYRPFVAKTLFGVPEKFRQGLLAEYHERGAAPNTNAWLRESVAAAFGGSTLSLAATDDEISQAAEDRAALVKKILARATLTTPEAITGWLQTVCERHGVNLPQRKTLMGIVERVCDPRWWRRSLRRQLMKQREAGAIKAGFVHKFKGLYVSDDAMHREQQAARKSALWMDRMELINEEGEILELIEAAKTNVSNPAIRFAEMVTRAKGEEEAANLLGCEAWMLTWTCPSRMHARLEKSGAPNPKYDGTDPGKAHKYLCGQFAKARPALGRASVHWFGVRIVEPHHDGTPHWHMLVFIRPEDRKNMLTIMRRYALEHDPDEPGAQKRRFKAERIDPNKGSAVGYLIKYLSKNIAGQGVGMDFEADGQDASETAPRVVVWAKNWRIRQFQFFGDSPVTIWRELRRLRETPPEAFLPYWQAADAGDWQGYMKAMQAAPLKLWTEEAPSQRYPGETITIIRGVELDGQRLETRQHRWRLREKAEFAAPWTCVNNCTGLDRGGGKIRPLTVEKPKLQPSVAYRIRREVYEKPNAKPEYTN